MAENSSGLGWSEAQWEKVNKEVTESFAKASVAGAFLPCYGPLPESAEYVRDEKFGSTGARVTVDDDDTLKLFNLTVMVELSREQVAEDALSSALLAFRRAANTLAQVEDHLVFNGRGNAQRAVQQALGGAGSLPSLNPNSAGVLVAGSGPTSLPGLVGSQTATEISASIAKKPVLVSARRKKGATPSQLQGQVNGDHLVSEVADAVVALEDSAHPGPFACILGRDAFVAAHTPATGLVLPADRITPILNGPLLRSGQMAQNAGIVVSLAGSDIDIVVATPPKVQFLQVTQNARYLFRVYEKFVWRIKDQTAVRGIGI